MPGTDVLDLRRAPFNRFKAVRRLADERSGHRSVEYARHQLYTARDIRTRTGVLIKVTSKPGIVYQQNLANEIASLLTINGALPSSPYFPYVLAHGSWRDGRIYLVTSLFDELPLATTIGPDPVPQKLVAQLRTALEVARALSDLHRLEIFHVDLNPMNILFRYEGGRPVIRIVDFESSYERARHANGASYNPPTTPGFTAPEVPRQAPDARSDLFSLGAVLYTMIAGHDRVQGRDMREAVESDAALDQELQEILRTALDPEPERRYGSMDALSTELGAYLERIWPGRPW